MNILKTTRFFTTFIVLLFIFIGNIYAEDDENTPKIPVKVYKIKMQDVNPPEKEVGHVESIESVEIMARVEGYIEKVNFKEGDFIKKGSLLYIIEQPPYKARLDAAKAEVKQAKAELFKAETKLKRLKSARPESVPQTDIDDAIANRDLAAGRLEQAKANLDTASINYGYTTIYAPITGRIGKTTYTKGNLVGPSSEPLAELKQMDPIRVVFSISENNISIIRNALKDMESKDSKKILSPEIAFSDGTKYPYKGIIDFVDNKVDPRTGTIAIWTKYNNPDHLLVPGEYVNVFIKLSKPEYKPLVPQRAVQIDNEGSFVLVVNEKNVVEIRRIETGKTIEDKWIVEKGLEEGDRVIVEGILKVKPGDPVNVITDDNKKI
ncbi:MAG: efflux RND transporter periplasmic adaptor subunit [Deferribacterota bacterium]|nr:efflux RND transporter periplasmic adaptor subunit [Deferribacterota bacterium]